MTYVITDLCVGVKDTACVGVCPVDCIHPDPNKESDAFASAPQLYIDPASCIDCGACQSACPVSAIFPGDEVTADQLESNASYFTE